MARPTEKMTMDRPFKYDASVKKDVFPAEHIFFEVAHHVPMCVDLYRMNQPMARHM